MKSVQIINLSDLLLQHAGQFGTIVHVGL